MHGSNLLKKIHLILLFFLAIKFAVIKVFGNASMLMPIAMLKRFPTPNPSVEGTAHRLRRWVPSALRAPAAPHFYRWASIFITRVSNDAFACYGRDGGKGLN